MSNYKLATRKVPKDASFRKLSTRTNDRKYVSEKEILPFSKAGLRSKNSFFVESRSARDLRGAISSATRRLNRKFISRTKRDEYGFVVGSTVYRVQ